MELKFINEGNRVQLHPDCKEAVAGLSPWHRHAVFHRVCQQVYQSRGAAPAPADSDLSVRGVDVLRQCLSTDDAGRISNQITATLEALGPNAGAHGPVSDDPGLTITDVPIEGGLRDSLRECLPLLLNSRTEQLLESYYGSYFQIYSALAYRTHANETHIGSFLWHRDVAPMAQVHLILYLTESGPETGATMVLDFAQTTRAAVIGYHYEGLDERIKDIEEIFTETGTDPSISCPDLQPGDGLVFSAARALHRGSLPKTGYRDTFTLVLLPSLVPWRQDIEEFGDDHIFGRKFYRTLETDPFQALSPAVPIRPGDKLSFDEQWVLAGHMFP